MPIYRSMRGKENPYLMVLRKTAEDNRLSLKARGLLMYLLAKRDDWNASIDNMAKIFKEGRAAIRTGLLELAKYKYMHRTQERVNGKFNDWIYYIYESPYEDMKSTLPETEKSSPVVLPTCDNRTSENPTSENRTQYNNKEIINTKSKENKKTSKEKRSPAREDCVLEIFNFWKMTCSKSEKTSLSPKRRSKIIKALESHSKDALKCAIEGCKASKWHQGHNPTGVVYDELELILRNEIYIDRFIQLKNADPNMQQKEAATKFKELFAGIK